MTELTGMTDLTFWLTVILFVVTIGIVITGVIDSSAAAMLGAAAEALRNRRRPALKLSFIIQLP